MTVLEMDVDRPSRLLKHVLVLGFANNLQGVLCGHS